MGSRRTRAAMPPGEAAGSRFHASKRWQDPAGCEAIAPITDQVGKQREIRVMLEELGAKRVQVGISSFLDPGYVDFGIVHAEVVAVDENGRPRQRSQAGGSF